MQTSPPSPNSRILELDRRELFQAAPRSRGDYGAAGPAASALPAQDLIEQPERIHAILAVSRASGHRGVLRRAGRSVGVRLEHFHAATAQLEWRADEPIAAWGAGPYDLEVLGYHSTYRMRLDAGDADGDRLVTPMPARLTRVRHRWHRRGLAPAGARVRFHHPLRRELGELQRDAVDLSFSGLGMRCAPEDLLLPGVPSLRLELETGDGETMTLRGELRHTTGPHADGHVRCGLRVQPVAADEARWLRFVARAVSPATRTSEDLEDGLWDLFTRSGFFSLAGKPSEMFEEVRLAFRGMAKRGAELPQLFCQAVWPSERGPEATLSIMKPYRHAWLGHQVARRPGKPPPSVQDPAQIMRDLYVRAFEHPQSDPDFRWVVSYAEAQSPWIEKAHVRYAERQMEAGHGLAYTRQVQILDVFTGEPTGRSHEGIDVGPAAPHERLLLVDSIARARPACYVEALDFTRERLDLRPVQARWHELGLEREREILIARRGGVPVAAAVLELGQRGTNLYGLLDMARLFSLTEAGPSTYVALVDAARGWYAARRRTSFHYLCEDDGGAYVQDAGIHGGPAPFLWIISATLIPDFLEHISELTIGRRWRPQRSLRPEVPT